MQDADLLKHHVGRRVAELRARAGLTQGDVAERIGTNTANFQRIEHGLQNVTLETLTRVANAIGVQVAEFFAPLAGEAIRAGHAGRRIERRQVSLPAPGAFTGLAERRSEAPGTGSRHKDERTRTKPSRP